MIYPLPAVTVTVILATYMHACIGFRLIDGGSINGLLAGCGGRVVGRKGGRMGRGLSDLITVGCYCCYLTQAYFVVLRLRNQLHRVSRRQPGVGLRLGRVEVVTL